MLVFNEDNRYAGGRGESMHTSESMIDDIEMNQ